MAIAIVWPLRFFPESDFFTIISKVFKNEQKINVES